MKTIFISLLLLGTLLSYGQSTLPVDSAQWKCRVSSFEGNVSRSYVHKYRTSSDTVINGISYTKMCLDRLYFNPKEYVFFLRYDTLMGEVYFRQDSSSIILPGMSTNTDLLLYSFHKNVNDTIILPWYGPQSRTFVVTGKGQVNINGSLHPYLDVSNEFGGTEFWIEGVGSTFDLLHPIRPDYGFHYNSFLICYQNFDSTIVHEPYKPYDPLMSCSYGIELEEQPKLHYKVYPNPVTDYLKIENPVAEARYTIYNLNGQLIRKGKLEGSSTIKIELTNLPNGLYLLQLQHQKLATSFKFLKQ